MDAAARRGGVGRHLVLTYREEENPLSCYHGDPLSRFLWKSLVHKCKNWQKRRTSVSSVPLTEPALDLGRQPKEYNPSQVRD